MTNHSKNLPKTDVLSGIQPTGNLHLGNLFGAITNWVDLQKSYKCAFCVVDYHALTTVPDAQELKANTESIVIDLLACGIDPNRSILFVQSDVPEHLELYWIFASLTRYGELARMTQFKEKGGNRETVGLGVLNYPVLQAADILLYGASKVPVGEDQLQHLELTREILRRFNKTHGFLFEEVKALTTKVPRILDLKNPSAKMSKSHPEGAVFIDDEEGVVIKKVKKAVTDTGDDQQEMSPSIENLMGLLHACNQDQYNLMLDAYNSQNLRYGDLKVSLGNELCEYLKPIRESKNEWLQKKEEVREILFEGAKKASSIARPRVEIARKLVGLG
mgnify:FL=1|tara:strand:+ start:1461 stop:2456 length:996 start_codon:yes stop_codon:yes gene_type:complete